MSVDDQARNAPVATVTDSPFLPYPETEDARAVAVGEHAGIQYAVIKIDTGFGQHRSHWACGYALLPSGHPWRDLDLQYGSPEGLDVHGGITYGPEADGWIGFDFNHGCDSWPGSYLSSLMRGGVPRTVEDVEAECLSLCEQIAAVSL